ncbi:unnamed protein product [Calicophoron daubneyi]|uniref:Glycylpeptide N-tetradecanoyltransferase n=1 Tax=Calicophoron daubneyi TaxID=300641 RepID=A0AAV2TMQ5_CALDB
MEEPSSGDDGFSGDFASSESRDAEASDEDPSKQLSNPTVVPGSELAEEIDPVMGKKKSKSDYRFWRTQPVPDFDEEIHENGPIEPDRKPDEIPSEPLGLPNGLAWCELSLSDDTQLQELYELLYENYVEADDSLFRFAYPKEFLKWVLQRPGWNCYWHIGVRVIKTGKLVSFIAGTPCEIQIYGQIRRMSEVSFLCLHKEFRSKRITPLLIQELTRRAHWQGLSQAVYTSVAFLPKPVTTCRYWHRPLNPRKLLECGFMERSPEVSLERLVKFYQLPEKTTVNGFRQMTQADLPQAWDLLSKYLQQFSLHPVYTEEEFRHLFLPRKDVVYSFVVANDDGSITDFCSYYILFNSVVQNKNHSTLKVAYSFYNARTVTRWPTLIQDVLITARELGCDVFNTLDLMKNKSFFDELKFCMGDGDLHYYLYNWRCSFPRPDQVALVLP